MGSSADVRPAAPPGVEDGNEAELLRLLIDSVKDYAIFRLDPEGRIASWNSGAERIKGYAAAEILGKHFSSFYTAEDITAGKCERELEGAARDGRFEGGKSKQSTFPVMGELLARFGGVGRVVGPVDWPGGRPLSPKLAQVGLALALALREASGQASSS